MTTFLREIAKNSRLIVLFLIWSIPCIVYLALGIVALYQAGWFWVLAWLLPANWLLAWLVAKYWKPSSHSKHKELQPLPIPSFWTERDKQALELVETHRAGAKSIDDDTVLDPQKYIADAQELARILANHYHGKSAEETLHPITIVEILSVIHLAVEDLEEWSKRSLPGSQVATIGDLSNIPGISKQLNYASNAMYIASVLFQPAKILAYPLYRKSSLLISELRREILYTLHQKYLQMAGFYLIEMYSGRLKAGSDAYKEQFGHLIRAIHHAKGDPSLIEETRPASLTIALLGQVNSGKSSLINALCQGQVAATSLLPETRTVQQYRFSIPQSNMELTLLDTPGYSEADAPSRQLGEIAKGLEAADLVLLVLSANSPAKQSDLILLQQVREHYQKSPHLKPPKVIGVLTHIDLLRPIREWEPPYDWRNPSRDKERSIASAVNYCQSLFGDEVDDYAAVCTREGLFDPGMLEELVSLITQRVSDGQAVSLVRAYYSRLKEKPLSKVLSQFRNLINQSVNR